jgi:type IV pilus assembly protein PilZ
VSEHRQHPRKNLTSPVAFQTGAGPRIEATCQDVSLGGMYIETSEPLAYGTKLRVFLWLPGLRHEAQIEGIVRWWKPTGMGVQFGVMGARETHALTTLLAGG